jgi:hypothetical protein
MFQCVMLNPVSYFGVRVEHKRLGHDPVQVSSMKALLRQPAGLTFITGSNAGVRTFVTSALGHGSLMLGPGHRAVLGIHRHIPDWFVPVDRVVYAFTPFTLFNV